MNAPLRRRLQLALRYYVRIWRDTPPLERGEYITKRLIWYLLLFCGGFLLQIVIDRGARRGRVGNIYILDDNEESGPTFVRVTTEALHLIQRVDPRRYRRIQREVRSIENGAMASRGAYYRGERKCRVHFSRIPAPRTDLPDRDYQWCLADYATILIHEATHGHFYSLGIPYTPKTRAFIERLCVQEEHRFALRLFEGDRQRADRLSPPFEAKKWERFWQESPRQAANRDRQAAREEERLRRK